MRVKKNFMKAVKNYFLYTFDYLGVVSRKEFWTIFPFVMALEILSLVLLFGSFVAQIISFVIFLVLLLPTVSLIVRRLHDTDRSAKYLLWWLVPFVGMVVVLIFLTEKTKYIIPEEFNK